ncbi:Pyridoxal phosphate homeostasis protein [Entamoeba marina]
MATLSYQDIVSSITNLSQQYHHNTQLVAVSKTKPKELIEDLYNTHHHIVFGENYIQELHEKAEALKDTCPDIKWHFIGRIQSNKIKLLCSTPNLTMIQTIHSKEVALKVQNVAEKLNKTFDVLVQINSSGEEQKGGVDVSDALNVIKEVMACKNLVFKGIMTIGMVGDAKKNFSTMEELASVIKTNLSIDNIEVSMGMSADYELAIEHGATMVRVGSALFGKRNYNK